MDPFNKTEGRSSIPSSNNNFSMPLFPTTTQQQQQLFSTGELSSLPVDQQQVALLAHFQQQQQQLQFQHQQQQQQLLSSTPSSESLLSNNNNNNLQTTTTTNSNNNNINVNNIPGNLPVLICKNSRTTMKYGETVQLTNRYSTFKLQRPFTISLDQVFCRTSLLNPPIFVEREFDPTRQSTPTFFTTTTATTNELICVIPLSKLATVESVTNTPVSLPSSGLALLDKFTFFPWKEVKDLVIAEIMNQFKCSIQRRNINGFKFQIVDFNNNLLSANEIVYRSSTPTEASNTPVEFDFSDAPIKKRKLQQQQQQQQQQQSTTTTTTTSATTPNNTQLLPIVESNNNINNNNSSNSSSTISTPAGTNPHPSGTTTPVPTQTPFNNNILPSSTQIPTATLPSLSTNTNNRISPPPPLLSLPFQQQMQMQMQNQQLQQPQTPTQLPPPPSQLLRQLSSGSLLPPGASISQLLNQTTSPPTSSFPPIFELRQQMSLPNQMNNTNNNTNTTPPRLPTMRLQSPTPTNQSNLIQQNSDSDEDFHEIYFAFERIKQMPLEKKRKYARTLIRVATSIIQEFSDL